MKFTGSKKVAVTTMLLCTLQAGIVHGEVLPWQTGQSQPAPQTATQGSDAAPSQHHRHGNGNAAQPQQYAPAAAPESSDQRTQDDRRLDELATKFYKAKPKDEKIISELKSVLKDVKAFHAELLERTYNAVDIIRDTESLEGRVSRQLSHLQAQEKAATPTTTAK